MRDVASLAQVSVQTVSNFVHGRHDEMSEQTRLRVGKALDQLGYRPNTAAASLRSQRIRVIAFIVVDEHARFLTDPLTDLIIAGVGDVARERSYGVLVQGARPSSRDPGILDTLRRGMADGAIAILSGPQNVRRSHLDELRQLGSPAVILDEIAAPDGLAIVRAEQQEGAKSLTEHLIRRGHKRIAFVGAKVPWAVVEQRAAGYREAMDAAGLRVESSLVRLQAGLDAQWGADLARGLLEGQSGAVPTAIICASDLLALGAMQAARSLGLRIPDDVAVAGFDDFQFSAFLEPPLTTVRVPAYDMGVRAAEILLSEVEKSESQIPNRIFPTQLIVRSSA
jgi:DNA-binding LacI/PurR family transcriptional regulator